MTWYVDPDTGEVIDHNGDVVASLNPTGVTLPDDVLDIMRDQMEGNQPSAYNQSLLADAATKNIEMGTPD